MSDEPRTCAHAHTFTPLLSSFCGSQLPDCITHWTLPPLPASLSFQMSYVRHPALRDKDRNSVSKWDLATFKLSSDSCRKGAWGGSTMQWQGRRETPPPPIFMITVKIDVQWVYENPYFCLCAPWRLEYSTMFMPHRRLDVQASHMDYTQTATLSCMNDDSVIIFRKTCGLVECIILILHYRVSDVPLGPFCFSRLWGGTLGVIIMGYTCREL